MDNYVLKISLLDIEPEIWRRFTVPRDISLDRLHDVIQIVMGWQDYHLHRFEIQGESYTETPESPEEGHDGAEYVLGDLVKRKGTEFLYVYDFGDNWEHRIVLEKTRHSVDRHDLPLKCLGGARACPPEDVGSVPGYFDFCESLNPGHSEHEENMAWYAGFPWYDGVFEPEKIDLDRINTDLAKYLRYSRPRRLPWNPMY